MIREFRWGEGAGTWDFEEMGRRMGRREPVPRGTRCLVACAGGAPRARLSTFLVEDLVAAPGPTGLVGHYEASDRRAGVELLARARELLSREGAARLLGPMNGSTWARYRLAATGEPPPFFLGEPENPPEYLDDFRQAGFREARWYESTLVEDLEAAGEPPPGVALAPLDPRHDFHDLYSLVSEAFADNLYYRPLRPEAFRSVVAAMGDRLDREMALVARASGRAVAFLFAYPDRLPGRVVLKTLATAPAWRRRGLGSWLVNQLHGRARKRGYRAVIHALMHADNASRRISRRAAGRLYRRYVLFGADPT